MTYQHWLDLMEPMSVWIKAHPIIERANKDGIKCYSSMYGEYEFHLAISRDAARWSRDACQRTARELFTDIIWC